MAKEQRAAKQTTQQNALPMTARVIGYEVGLRTFHDVRGIRILSRDHTLLVMLDHAPLLGKVEGSVVLVCDSGEHKYENIRGFYKHQHNEFTLLLDGIEAVEA